MATRHQATLCRRAAAGLRSGGAAPERAPENSTGLPDDLRAGLEEVSGLDLSAVRVHYDSPAPARIAALAYTQGTDIVVGPGQERHLPHEGWHVVQQMRRRVTPTVQAKGMSMSDDPDLEREADLMGQRALEAGAKSVAAAFPARIDAPSDTAEDDEHSILACLPVLHPQPGAGVIQRAASFDPGTVTTKFNLAELTVKDAPFLATTDTTLNGKTALNDAQATAAIQGPGLAGRSTVSGQSEVWIDSMPTNIGSFDMQLPTNGPWSVATKQEIVGPLFNKLGAAIPTQCNGGPTTFTLHGKPTDAGFAAQIRTHENLHAKDHQLGFVSVMVPWDVSLQALKSASRHFTGATPADAEAALFAAAGGTPSEVAIRQIRVWEKLVNQTHFKDFLNMNKMSQKTNFTADATCANMSFDQGTP